MAVLQKPLSCSHPFAHQLGDALAPAGTFIATVIDIRDEFGVTRQKFQSEELEKVDLCTFLFGFRDARGKAHKVSSRQMRISGNEKSALFAFLKNLLGRAPAYGWDYCVLKGTKCLLTIEHVTRKDGNGVFPGIAVLSPVPAGYSQPEQPAAPMPAEPLQPPQTESVTVPGQAPVPPAAPCVANQEDAIPF